MTYAHLAQRWTYLLAVLWLSGTCCSAQEQTSLPTANELPLHLSDQRIPSARLIDIDDQGFLQYQVGEQSRGVSLLEIVRWTGVHVVSGADIVCLSDSSWLAGRIEWKNAQTIVLTSDWFETIELPLDDVRGLLFRPSPSQQKVLELQQKMLAHSGSSDALWNARSEQLSGIMTVKLRATSEGKTPLRPVWSLQPSGAADKVELENDMVQAIIFSPALHGPIRRGTDYPLLTLRDGSRLRVESFSRESDGRVKVILSDRRSLMTIDTVEQFIPAIAALTGQPPGITWLSDLEPARYRLLDEAQELSWPLGRNQDLFGRVLFKQSQPVRNSLVIHSPAQAAYRWDGSAGKFLAEVQLLPVADAAGTSLGSALCKVLVARAGQLQEVFNSGVLRAETPSVAIAIDISDAQLVVLLVEEADQGTVGDHALWREARFVREEPLMSKSTK